MSYELRLGDDAERALREAENFCWRTNVAILGAEHLLAGALVVLGATGLAGMPTAAVVEAALVAVQGVGAEELSDNVKFGSAARDALAATALRLRESGETLMDALAIARGVIESGEVNPMFFGELGVAKEQLLAALPT